MLNTDVHSKSLKGSKKMTKVQFVKNCGGIDYEKEFSKEMLGKIYDEISGQEIAHQIGRHDDGNLFADSVKEGYMKKQGATAPYNWKKRYFILARNPPQLCYFTDDQQADPIGYIPLDNDVIVVKSETHTKGLEILNRNGGLVKSVRYNKKREMILGEHKKTCLKGATADDCWEWIHAIQSVLPKQERG